MPDGSTSSSIGGLLTDCEHLMRPVPVVTLPRCSLSRFSISDLLHRRDLIAHRAFAMIPDQNVMHYQIRGFSAAIPVDRRYALRLTRVLR